MITEVSKGWLYKLYSGLLLLVLAGIVLHAPISVFFGGVVWPQYAEIVKAWKEILLLISFGLAVILVVRARLWRRLYDDILIRLIAAYALLHVLFLFVFDTGALSSLAGLMIDLRYVLYFVLVYIAVILRPDLRRPFLITATIGAAIVAGFGLLQVLALPDDVLRHVGYGPDTIKPYITIDQNPDYVRINSTMRGPNPLGAYAGIVLAVLAAAMVQRKVPPTWRWRLLVAGVGIGSLVSLWASYSRSALIGAITALLFILFTTIGKKIGWKKITTALLVLLVVTASTLFAFRDTSFVTNVVLHENPGSSSVSKSNPEHLDSLIEGTELMLSQPFGAGVGSTGSASLYGDKPLVIENQYLFVAHETGWLGLAMFLGILGLIMWRLWQQRSDWLALGLLASGIGLSLIGVLLPVWADDTVSLAWWGLAGLALGYGQTKVSKKKGQEA